MRGCVLTLSLLVFLITSVRGLPYREYGNSWSPENYANAEEQINDPESEKVQEDGYNKEFLNFFRDQNANVENEEHFPKEWGFEDDVEDVLEEMAEEESEFNRDDTNDNIEEPSPRPKEWAFEDEVEDVLEEMAEEESEFDRDDTNDNVEEPSPQPPSEGGFSPDNVMVQFFNSPGDPDMHIQEVDWNDRDFLKEEYDLGFIQDKWNTEEDFQKALEESQTERIYQQGNDGNNGLGMDDVSHLRDIPLPQGDPMFSQEELPAFENSYEAWMNSYPEQDIIFEQDGDAEEVWNDMNVMESLNMQGNADERERITREIDDAYSRMRAVNQKLEALERRQDREGNLTECKTKLCSPCEVKQICVEKNAEGECISEEPETKECCKVGYEPRCKEKKEAISDRIGEEIKKAMAQMEGIEKEFEGLSDNLAELDKSALNPN